MLFNEDATPPVLDLPPAIPELTSEEFRLFQGLVLAESGINLGTKSRALLVNRLWKRLRALELASFSSYYRLVKRDPAEMVRMLDCICTNETRFFREPATFDCLRERVFPEWMAAADAQQRSKTLRVWSAACSTGEEPYSLAMMLLTAFPASAGWTIDVLATDLSTKVLAQASRSVWPLERMAAVPIEHRSRFLLKGFGPDKGKIKATDELRSVVRFQRLNLTQAEYDVFGPFDLIFCRNVIIYFQWDTKLKVIDHLGRHLAPNGYLFLGHAESLHGVTDRLESVKPKFFRTGEERAGHSGLCILERRNRQTAL